MRRASAKSVAWGWLPLLSLRPVEFLGRVPSCCPRLVPKATGLDVAQGNHTRLTAGMPLDKEGARLTEQRPPDAGWADRTVEGGMKTIAGCLAIPILGIVGFTFLTTTTCSQPTQVTSVATSASPTVATDMLSSPTPTKPLTFAKRSMICRARIAAVMGRDPKTMKATKAADDLIRIQYRRPDDGKLWKSECKLVGNRIVWRGVDSFGNDGPGRWRDGPDDEALTFEIDGNTVTTNSSDGSSASETYRF